MKMKQYFEGASTELIKRAITSFDRATIIVVVACWSAALVITVLALYTGNLVSHARINADEAAALEPSLPRVQRTILKKNDLEQFSAKLAKLYPRLQFTVGNDSTLAVFSTDPKLFTDWLTSLSYIDTMAPQIRWSFKDFCVGSECPANSLMRATLVAERNVFAPPPPLVKADE